MRMNAFSRAVAVSGALLSVGCGAEVADDAQSRAASRPIADVSILERLGHADCEAAATPAGLAAKAPIVLRGVIEGVTSGPATLEPHNPGELLQRNHLILRIDVTQIVKGAALLGQDRKHVFVAMGRGMNVVRDTDGEVDPATDPNPSVTDFRHAIPDGNRVVIFTSPFDWATTGKARFEQEDAGRPAGSTLLGGFLDCGQGVNFDPGTGPVGGWKMTFDQLDAAVKSLS